MIKHSRNINLSTCKQIRFMTHGYRLLKQMIRDLASAGASLQTGRTGKWLFAGLVLLIACSSTVIVTAQDASSRRSPLAEKQRTVLGARQKLVERKMVELEGQLTQIADRIREKDPKKADRLVEAYQQSREQLITRKMAEAVELLDQNKLLQAEETLDEVVQNLDRLIRLLINQKTPEVSKQQEIEMLEQMKQDIQKRIEEQRDQRQEVAKVSDKDAATEKLDGQIKELNNLIKRQQDAIKQAKEKSNAGLRALDKVADEQFEIRKATEDLAKDVANPDGESGEEKSGEQQPGESDSKDGEGGESKEGEPSEGESSEPKDGEGKSEGESGKPSESEESGGEAGDESGDGKPSEGSGGGKPSQGKPGEGQPSGGEAGGSGDKPQPGQEALEKAAEQQRSAEEKLGSARAEEAAKDQQKALDNLEKARAELKKEKRRIESLPPEALKDLADKQRRTRDKAIDLVEKMAEAPKSKQGDEGQDPGQQQTPGQQQMEDAGESMKQAAGNLDEGNTDQAQQNQKQAQQKMEEALDEIEERLNQLREETREEKLARLEARFREMYDRQKVASAMTIDLDDKKVNLGSLNRREQLLLLRIATDELDISEVGQQAYDLLLEDGTSIVFPEALQDLRTDLDRVAAMLYDEQTNRLTQLLQKEIEAGILDLLDSLEEAKKEEESDGGGGGGGGGDQPLLKKSAELKILRMQQQRLNRRTRRVDQLRGSDVPDATLDREVNQAAEMQIKLLEITERLMEKE